MIQNSCAYLELGNVALDSGQILTDTRLAFVTFGLLNETQDNAVLVLTHFGGTHLNSQFLIGPDMALDPKRYFIVVANLFGNGMSSSPSDGLGPLFPIVSMEDNVRLQHKLMTEHLDVRKLALVTGHSMGGIATYHWAALFPDIVDRAAPICSAAKISDHNWVFLEGLRGIVTSDKSWEDGYYNVQPVKALKTMARAWAAWPPSSHFYREQLYKTIGYSSLEDYLLNYWEKTYESMDANNILAQFDTWESADISANKLYNNNMEKALASIRAKLFVIPSTTDAYFPVEDSKIEVSCIPNAELRPIKSNWGHWAGSGRNADDTSFINDQLVELLNI